MQSASISPSEKRLLGALNLLGLAAILIGFILADGFAVSPNTLRDFGPLCLFKYVTHLPCATCGITRGFVLMSQGQWIEASHYNLMTVPLYSSILLFWLLSIFKPRKALQLFRSLEVRQSLWILMLALGITWAIKLMGPHSYW